MNYLHENEQTRSFPYTIYLSDVDMRFKFVAVWDAEECTKN